MLKDTNLQTAVGAISGRVADDDGQILQRTAFLADSTALKKLPPVNTCNPTIFKCASQLFNSLQHEPRADDSYNFARNASSLKMKKAKDLALPDVKQDFTLRQIYELVFSTLKYQYILEDILNDAAFFVKYPETLELSPLVMVILCDALLKRFSRKDQNPREIIYEDVFEIEHLIQENKIKFEASLARRRIKENARSLEDLLPPAVKAKDQLGRKILTYAWCNSNKTSLSQVIAELQSVGYSVLPASSADVTGTYFCLDSLFEDTLVFSAEQRTVLPSLQLVQDGCLVIQDKTSLFAPHTCCSLLNESEDVMIIDSGSGATAAHLSSLMKHAGKTGTIWWFKHPSDHHNPGDSVRLANLGSHNIKVIEEPFDMTDVAESRFQTVKIILLNGICSKSSVLDPVGYILTEAEDLSIIKDSSVSKSAPERISEMARSNLAVLRHAIQFPKVQAVMFITRSIYDHENENVVQKAIEHYNSNPMQKHLYRVVPPLFKFDKKMAESRKSEKYYRHSPSEQANGCFVALFTREIEEKKESAKDILSRAAASGLLSGACKQPSNNDGGDNSPSKVKARKTKSSKTRKKKSAAVAFGSTVSKKPSARVKAT